MVSEMVSRRAIILLFIGLFGVVLLPSPPQSKALSDSATMTSSRIRLSDGRYLAYKEKGVPKNRSNFKIIIVHGFGSSKDMNFLAPKELIDELSIYFVLYDRAGYGESDPNPNRSVKSEAMDIEELADQLGIGSKFYVIGVSMGSYPTWSCLKYIPHRLAGAAFVVPVVNYQWPSIPRSVIREDYRSIVIHCALFVVNYAPGLLYWLVTQKWFNSGSSSYPRQSYPAFFNTRDLEALKTTKGFPMLTPERLRQKGVFDTLRGDFTVAFGRWEFDPMELSDPFPQNQSNVHIWQGYEDKVVPFEIQRFVSKKLPWIRYHEVSDGGHLIVHYDGLIEAILRALLLGEEPLKYKPNVAKIVA